MISAGTARSCERTLSHFAGIGMCPTSSFCNVASHLPCLLNVYRLPDTFSYTDSNVIPTSLHSRENAIAASRKVGIIFLSVFRNVSDDCQKSV